MRSTTIYTALALAALAPAAVQAVVTTSTLKVQPQSKLWIEGSSTVRSFECRVPTFDAAVEAVSANAPAAILAGEKAVRTVSLTVPAGRINCGNGTMNEHMAKALKSSEHQSIDFRLSTYDLTADAAGTNIRMEGRLTLGGVEKPVTLRAAAKEGPGGTLQVTGTHEVKMSDHGLRPPSLMMGTMKVGDVVKVRYDLILKP